MWAPPPPEPEPRGWWHELSLDRWVAGVAADMRDAERAERIEHLKALAHRVDMAAAGALSADRWERIQRRRDLQGAVRHPGGMLVNQWANRPHGGYQIDSWGARGEVEHRGGGWILGVR